MYEGDYVLYGDFVASEDGYSVKKKKKKHGKKKIIEICESSNLGVFAFLAASTLTINISLSFMFSLMVDIMITGTTINNSVTITNNNNNNNNNNNMNMNMNTNRRRRKRAVNQSVQDEELKLFIKELNTPSYHLKKCTEERTLFTLRLIQILYDINVSKNGTFDLDNSECRYKRLLEDYSTVRTVCNF